MKKDLIQKAIDSGLLLTLIVFPLSLNIALVSPDDITHPIISFNFTLADLLIGVVLVLWILKVLLYKEWSKIYLPPVAIFVFIGVGILSFVNAYSISGWLKELIQLIEYLVIFYMLIINNLIGISLNTYKVLFYLITTIVLSVAVIQLVILNGDAYLIRGLLENHNTLGAFLCITIPVIYNGFSSGKSLLFRAWSSILLLLTCFVITSGSALLSIIIGITVISCFYGKKGLLRYAIFMCMLLAVIFFAKQKREKHSLGEFLDVYERGSISHNYYRVVTLTFLDKNEIFSKPVGKNNLVLYSENYLSAKVPEIKRGDRYLEMEGQRHVKNRYLEMLASLNLISDHTLLGVGLGNFQNQIGTYYKEFPKVNTAEPNQHNGYLVIGSTTGVLGLAALMWILLSAVQITVKRIRNENKNRNFFIGILGSFVACLIINCFVDLLISSLLVPFVFVLSVPFKTTFE